MKNKLNRSVILVHSFSAMEIAMTEFTDLDLYYMNAGEHTTLYEKWVLIL